MVEDGLLILPADFGRRIGDGFKSFRWNPWIDRVLGMLSDEFPKVTPHRARRSRERLRNFRDTGIPEKHLECLLLGLRGFGRRYDGRSKSHRCFRDDIDGNIVSAAVFLDKSQDGRTEVCLFPFTNTTNLQQRCRSSGTHTREIAQRCVAEQHVRR